MTKDPAIDCGLPGERVNYDVEQAYRRGVVQGAAFATRLIENGSSEIDLRRWIDKRLAPWRRKIRKQRRKTDNTTIAEPTPAPKRGFVM